MRANMADTYVCAQCFNEFEKGQSEEEASAEAFANFGVVNPADCDDMAIVCDDCYNQILGIDKTTVVVTPLSALDKEVLDRFAELFEEELAKIGIPRKYLDGSPKEH